MEHLNKIVEAIKYHQQKYWEGNPEISDQLYDQLIERLRSIDPNHEILNSIEYNRFSTNKKVSHSKLMLSLEKKYSFQDVISWVNKVTRPSGDRFKIQPKYDGIAAKFYHEDKLLATRGDGSEGEDITSKLKLIELISPNFNNWDEVNIDLLGEIIITQPNFLNCTYTKKNGDKYKTPRNLAAGILNLKEIDDVIGKVKLSFIDYEFETLSLKSIDLTENVFRNIVSQIKNSDYPTDGVVFKLEDEKYGESLGSTDHHYRNAIAYKPEDLGVETILKNVILQHGKNKLTPVAILEPVIINNVEIKRASLHNAKFLLDNDVHIGDILEIIRSNDVIPYVQNVIAGKERKKLIFNSCNFCGSNLIYKEPELYCSNTECVGNLSRKLVDSVKSLGIEELGLPTIEKMISRLGVSSILDIINLSKFQIALLDGFAETSTNKLFENIQKVKNSPIADHQILSALNIQGIGKGICKTLLERFNIDELCNLEVDQLIHIPGIGVERAVTINEALIVNRFILSQLRESFKVIETKIDPAKKRTFQKICFSGTFNLPKNHYKQIARQKGFEVVDSVTRDLKYLVTSGALTDKVSKARQYNIEILDVKEFMKL